MGSIGYDPENLFEHVLKDEGPKLTFGNQSL